MSLNINLLTKTTKGILFNFRFIPPLKIYLNYFLIFCELDSTNATLLIRNVCGEDLADYACVAKNIRCKTHLEMKDSQVLSKLPEVFISPAGKDVHLTSTLKKDHLDQNDSIQWHKNGKFLVDEKSKYSKYTIKRGMFTFYKSLLMIIKFALINAYFY